MTETYQYNGIGGAVSRKQTDITLGSGATALSFEQSWTYNDLGRIATTTYPEEVGVPAALPDLTVVNGFTNGWLTSASPGVEQISYHANGMMDLLKYQSYFSGTRFFGMNFDRDPNWMQRPREIHFIGLSYEKSGEAKSTPESEAAEKGDYSRGYWDSGVLEYDGLGNLVAQRGYSFSPSMSEQGNRFFEYDAQSRIKSLTTTSESTSQYFSYQGSFEYDPFGNLITRTLNDNTFNYAVDADTNHLSGAVYDDAGNQRSWGVGNQSYLYDFTPFKQIRKYSAPGATRFFVYSADGERVYTYDPATSEGTFVLRDFDAKALRTVAHQQGSGALSWKRDYFYGGHILVGATSPEGDFRLFTDQLGNVRLVTQWSQWGDIVEINNYSPFGEEFTEDSLGSAQKLRFTGHERDLMSPTGSTDDLDYMHARHYNMNLARFLSVDPVGGDPARPQSWNAYSYALNNPLNLVDPTGMMQDVPNTMVGEAFGKRPLMVGASTPEQRALDKGIATAIAGGLLAPAGFELLGPEMFSSIMTNMAAGSLLSLPNVAHSDMNIEQKLDTVMTRGAVWGVTGVFGGPTRMGLFSSIASGFGGDLLSNLRAKEISGRVFTVGDAASAPFSGVTSGAAVLLGGGNLYKTVFWLVAGSLGQQFAIGQLPDSSLAEANRGFRLNLERNVPDYYQGLAGRD